jgi:hypothetical protein
VSLRWVAIAFFAVAAVLVGIGNATKERWLVAIAILCFLAGSAAFLRWRTQHGRVLASEEKTLLDQEEKASKRNGHQ